MHGNTKAALDKRGQVWIETVLYTLIGLVLIGVVLAVSLPKINASRDRILVEQTIASLSVFDEKIIEALSSGPGNRRAISSFGMKRGELYFNSSPDSIAFVLSDLNLVYSEPGVEIEQGKVTIISEAGNNEKTNSVRLLLDYSGIVNLTFSGAEEIVKFTASPTPYSFVIENQGSKNGSEIYFIDITEVSRG